MSRGGYYRNVMRKIDAALLRRRHIGETDVRWRRSLQPTRQHPRRDPRRPEKPR